MWRPGRAVSWSPGSSASGIAACRSPPGNPRTTAISIGGLAMGRGCYAALPAQDLDSIPVGGLGVSRAGRPLGTGWACGRHQSVEMERRRQGRPAQRTLRALTARVPPHRLARVAYGVTRSLAAAAREAVEGAVDVGRHLAAEAVVAVGGLEGAAEGVDLDDGEGA